MWAEWVMRQGYIHSFSLSQTWYGAIQPLLLALPLSYLLPVSAVVFRLPPYLSKICLMPSFTPSPPAQRMPSFKAASHWKSYEFFFQPASPLSSLCILWITSKNTPTLGYIRLVECKVSSDHGHSSCSSLQSCRWTPTSPLQRKVSASRPSMQRNWSLSMVLAVEDIEEQRRLSSNITFKSLI